MVEIQSWWKLPDLLKTQGALGKTLATAVVFMDEIQQVTLVRRLVSAAIANRDGDGVIVMLEALVRSVGKECGPGLNTELETLYWKLPLSVSDAAGDWSMFVKARLLICTRLLDEWTPDSTNESSLHAFRRLIAMGWPLTEGYPNRLEGESEMEFAARGRVLERKEQNGVIDLVGKRLEVRFVYNSEMNRDSDAIFGPWLAQPHVPFELQMLLAMARAKHGGIALAKRDMHNAEILRGLPQSGLDAVAFVTERMRKAVADGELVLERLIVRLRELYPRFHARENLKREVRVDLNTLTIRIGPCYEADELFAEAVLVTDGVLRNEDAHTLETRLVVQHLGEALVKCWPKT